MLCNISYCIIFTFFSVLCEKSTTQTQVESTTEQHIPAATTSNSSTQEKSEAISTKAPKAKTLPKNTCESNVRDWRKSLRSSTKIKSSSSIVNRTRRVPKMKLKMSKAGDEKYYKIKN